ncbi:MAG: cobalamin B12-binding domain-containing protein [Methylococcales bacterium]
MKTFTAVLTTIRSDSHTWNLVFMHIWLCEHGLIVTNLGSCVPESEVAQHCRLQQPDLLVVSTVNGHGGFEGESLIRTLASSVDLSKTVTVIGGKLATGPEQEITQIERLQRAGFDAVLTGQAALQSLTGLIALMQRNSLRTKQMRSVSGL